MAVPCVLQTLPHHFKRVGAHNLHRHMSFLTRMSSCHRNTGVLSLHTWGALRTAAEPRPKGQGDSGRRSGGSGEQQGSVLAQFVGKAEEPKQVTVATKGWFVLLFFKNER